MARIRCSLREWPSSAHRGAETLQWPSDRCILTLGNIREVLKLRLIGERVVVH